MAVPELNSHRRAACHMVRDTDEKKKRRAEGDSAGNWVRKIVGSPSAAINPPTLGRKTRFKKFTHQHSARGEIFRVSCRYEMNLAGNKSDIQHL